MTLSRRFVLSAAVLSLAALAACSPAADQGVPEVADQGTQEVDAGQSAPVSYLEQAGLSGAAVALAGGALAEALQPAAGIQILPTDAGVALEGAMEADATSGGRTGGVFLEIAAPIADAIAGQTITVTFVARSMDGGGLRAAFSTSQIGNSGWRDLTLTDTFAPVSFQYDVPRPDAADVNPDFLGFASSGGTVEIAAVAVAIEG
jgi:hypothetical protein